VFVETHFKDNPGLSMLNDSDEEVHYGYVAHNLISCLLWDLTQFLTSIIDEILVFVVCQLCNTVPFVEGYRNEHMLELSAMEALLVDCLTCKLRFDPCHEVSYSESMREYNRGFIM